MVAMQSLDWRADRWRLHSHYTGELPDGGYAVPRLEICRMAATQSLDWRAAGGGYAVTRLESCRMAATQSLDWRAAGWRLHSP